LLDKEVLDKERRQGAFLRQNVISGVHAAQDVNKKNSVVHVLDDEEEDQFEKYLSNTSRASAKWSQKTVEEMTQAIGQESRVKAKTVLNAIQKMQITKCITGACMSFGNDFIASDSRALVFCIEVDVK